MHGTENPNLMPKNSITVRMHSVGGWGAITTGKNLAMTLFDLLGYDIKANPKYGSEKKGQPTTYYLSAAPEPIRINCEYIYVDVVLSPDPHVFQHSNPLAGLNKGGVFILQSTLEKPEDVWAQIPERFQRIIVDNKIRVFFLDAFKIAREEASDPELQLRMQGNAFQGAFFAASPVMSQAKLDEQKLFTAIRSQLEHKFGRRASASSKTTCAWCVAALTKSARFWKSKSPARRPDNCARLAGSAGDAEATAGRRRRPPISTASGNRPAAST